MAVKRNADNNIVLKVQDLELSIHTYAGDVKALDGVNLELKKGEALGLVGESGCGKSVTALAIVRLLPETATIESGRIILTGDDLSAKSDDEMRRIRASKIAIVFQDPMTYLNPVLSIGEQLTEVFLLNREALAHETYSILIRELQRTLSSPILTQASVEDINAKIARYEAHRSSGAKPSSSEIRRAAWIRGVEYLRLVRIPDAERIMKEYPHRLSGGMRQRAMIAMALGRNPVVLIADEITTALDVTIQAQILDLLHELRSKIETSIILISHDLGVVASICDRVAVMYAGNVVEIAKTTEIFRNPLHPYTQGLLKAIPGVGEKGGRLESIPGTVPDLINPPSGCRFHPRCPYVFDRCRVEKPLPRGAHKVECHLY